MATMKKIRFGKHKYYAKEVIGKGQFGVVYYAKARKRRKDNGDKIPKYVAIKEYYYSRFYDPSTKQNSCEEYFNREIKCTAIQSKYSGASLNLIDSGKIISKSNKEYYIVLSYIEGKPLDKWFADSFGKHPHLDDDEINFFTNNIIIPLARHLNFCHSKGLVHRDLSIDNIMIKSPQKGAVIPVIIDWGAAKVRKPSEIMHPPKGYMQNQIMSNTAFVNKGTPPEIRRGYPPMAASDIYMLGHIMYYLYGGGVSSRPPKTVDDYVLHPKDNNPQLDSRYDQLVAKCTQYNPSDRIENMEENLHVLEKIQDDFSPSRITFFGKPKSFGRSAPPVKSISSGTNTAGKAYSNKPKSQRSPVQARSSGKPSKNPSDTSAKKRGKKPGAHPINYAHLGEGAKSAKK